MLLLMLLLDAQDFCMLQHDLAANISLSFSPDICRLQGFGLWCVYASAFWFCGCCCRAGAGAGSAFCFARAGAGAGSAFRFAVAAAVLVLVLVPDTLIFSCNARGDIMSGLGHHGRSGMTSCHARDDIMSCQG